MSLRALLGPMAIALFACSDTGGASLPTVPPGYGFAYATAACAPWDGPATALSLGPSAPDSTPGGAPPAPYISIAIWRPLDSLPGARMDLAGSANLGAAIACRAPGDCERASAATIRFQPAGPDSVLEGSIDLSFPTRGHVAGGFRATWRSQLVPCG